MNAQLLKKIKQRYDYVSLQLNTESCCRKSHPTNFLWVKHENRTAVKTSMCNSSNNGFIKKMTGHKQLWETYYGRTAKSQNSRGWKGPLWVI